MRIHSPDRHRPPVVSPRPQSQSQQSAAARLPQERIGRLSLALAGAGILTQIADPLLAGQALRATTMLSVLLLAGAAVVHAAAAWGPRAAARLLVVAGGLGWAAEAIGVHTGFPFGHYSYTAGLGPRLAGVPLLVPLAWAMLAYPALILGRRLGTARVERSERAERPAERRSRRVITILAGGACLAAWDLFLDPQMVAAGNWSWADPSPALPGVAGVPLSNYAGWLLVSLLMIAALDGALPDAKRRGAEPSDAQPSDAGPFAAELTPAIVLAWTWLGSTVGNLVFFDRPWTALYGGAAMGALTLPYLLTLWRQPAQRRHDSSTESSRSSTAKPRGEGR